MNINHTDGLYGFRFNGKDYIFLFSGHSGIFSEEQNGIGFGEHIFSFVKDLVATEQKETLIADLKHNLSQLKRVSADSRISDEDKRFLVQFDEECGLGTKDSLTCKYWGDFFTTEAGNLYMYLEGFPVYISFATRMLMSKVVGYAYVVNLDDEVFEIYIGGNTESYSSEFDRYSDKQHETFHEGHFGVKLLKRIPFAEIHEDTELSSFFGDAK